MLVKILLNFLLLIATELEAQLPGKHCTAKSTLTGQYQVRTDGGKPEINTVFQTLLKKNDNACFEIRAPNSTTKESLFLNIHLEDVWLDYQIKKHYNFTIPSMDVDCKCECPGLDNPCNRKHELDSECNGKHRNGKQISCFKKYFSEHSSSGCFLSFLYSGAEYCCTAAIFSDKYSDIYQAIYLESPKVDCKLKVTLQDSDGNEIKNTNITYEKLLPKVTTLPFATWAYIDSNSKNLMVNAKINDVDEYRLDKLGWFKLLKGHEISTINPVAARNALELQASSCHPEYFTYTFSAIGVIMQNTPLSRKEKLSEFGQPIQEYYKSVVDTVDFTYRSIRVHPRTENRMLLNANLRFEADVLLHRSAGSFTSFNSCIMLDEHSSHVLKLVIENAVGELEVSVFDKKTNSVIFKESFTVPAKNDKNFEKILRLSNFKCTTNRKVCLQNVIGNPIKYCTIAQCFEKAFVGPRKNDDAKSPGGDNVETESQPWYEAISGFFKNMFGNGIFGNITKVIFGIIGIIVIIFITRFVIKIFPRNLFRKRFQKIKVHNRYKITPDEESSAILIDNHEDDSSA